METLRVLFFGDVVGSTGRNVFQKYVAQLKEKYRAQVVIVNGENAASTGRGIAPKHMAFFKHNHVDVVTSGNHVFQKKDILPYLDEHDDLLRPLNYPSMCPGKGLGIYEKDGITFGVVSLCGRVFFKEFFACPVKTLESALTYINSKTPIALVDFHAEATAEKKALALCFDGKISALIGTHTHVQTADEQILPGKTAFISDAGMAGSYHSSIGMKPGAVIRTMITQMPSRFTVETEPPFILSGVMIEIDARTGDALNIERFQIIDQA